MTGATTTVSDLLDEYDVLLLDAYGVLVHGGGALPHAAAFVDAAIARGRRLAVLSNDASRLPETSAARYRGLGLRIEPDQIITSGSLLAAHFRDHGLQGSRCVVLGPPDSAAYVARAGGVVVDHDAEADAIVVCDDDGYPFLPTVEAVLDGICRRIDAGRPVQLVLPNPDLIYPKGNGSYGLTAGMVAVILERALAVRYGHGAPRFTPLGKPHPPMFAAARQRLSIRRGDAVVMLGDQLATDIAGAQAAGFDTALVGTGLTPLHAPAPPHASPIWRVEDLRLTDDA